MVEQTLESTDTKVPAFTAVAANTGETAWGYQTEATTGIVGVTVDDNSQLSTLNCQLSTYDLQGRRVNSNSKGLIIRNGKKYIAK
jgi:hypothetical protein